MLLHYRKQIIAILISLLAWLPFAGLHAQIVDINNVNITADTMVQLGRVQLDTVLPNTNLNINSDALTKHDSVDHCNSHQITKMDKNCVSDGDTCQCYNSSCCSVISMLPGLQNSSCIYTADENLGDKISQAIPLLTLPTEIKPPRKLV